MKGKTTTTQRKGQRDGFKTGVASQLARCLAIPGLSRLSDNDAELLNQYLAFIEAQAAQRGFSNGWDAATEYNCDMKELLALAPLTMTEH